MKKLMISILALLTFSSQASDPLRFTNIKATLVANNPDRYDIEVSIAGGSPNYTYGLLKTSGGNSIIGPTPLTTATFINQTLPNSQLLARDSTNTTTGMTILPPQTSPGSDFMREVSYDHPCGESNGEIRISASPSSSGTSYSLNGDKKDSCTGTSSCTYTDLPAGSYTSFIFENPFTFGFVFAELKKVRMINFRPPTVTPVTCCGADNGTILLKEDQIAGGKPPYTYSIGTNVGFIPVGDPFMNLEAGTYEVTVKDANGCLSESKEVTVDPAQKIKICCVFTTPARCPKENGTIRIFAKSKAELQYAIE